MTSDDLNLGTYRRPASTDSPAAAACFDRGLLWAYAFNHEEAIDCFEEATRQDRSFALAYWGIAYAAGPNYNKTWEAFDEVDRTNSLRIAHDAIAAAQQLSSGCTAVEAKLIAALAQRFPEPHFDGDASAWDEAYAGAMAAVYEAHPEDLDVVALYVDSMISLTAWQLWDLSTGIPPAGAQTERAQEILEGALELPGGSEHPGLLHFYIHLMEMSPEPQRALPAADALRELAPDAGHLVHMPTHIDVLCGDFERTMRDNARAAAADMRYVAAGGSATFYALYRAHNQHFRAYAAMMAGNRRVALESAAALEESIPEELLRVEVPPLADWLEGFISTRLHVLVRFGSWDEVMELPMPRDRELYCTRTAMTHYARVIACASLGQVDSAEHEQELFQLAFEVVPESRTLFNNTCRDILTVAEAMLAGEIEYRRGRFDLAFETLRSAVELDDNLPYDEPWGWMQPVRHALGALLLEQGRVEEARGVYAADLGLDPSLPRACQHPGNIWSLHGLHECLTRLGEEATAGVIEQQLEIAGARADVPVQASCFCRLECCS